MYNKNGRTRIFYEKELSDYLNKRMQDILLSIENESDDYILNVNEEDYIKFKTSQAKVEPIEIYVDNIYASSSEEMIPAKYFPNSFFVKEGKSYKKNVIKFHIPYSGDQELLKCSPSSRLLWSVDVEITKDEFCFEIINFNNEADEIAREKDDITSSIMKQYTNLKKELNQFNSNLETKIRSSFKKRKERIIVNNSVLSSLGVPIKKSSSSETFSVPALSKKKKVVLNKPDVKQVGYKPEPSLDEKVYLDILTLIHDVGKEFERLPSLYANKEEEHLRDHFLMMLEPNFEGTATGETFNKTGKTDILLRYKGTNVFVGECKFWRGKKIFFKTIDQLLGYLTWRDSKAAVIIFVPNKDFSSVLVTVKDSLEQHLNFLRIVSEREKTWFNCEFHLNEDRNRVVKVAIMLYHTPR